MGQGGHFQLSVNATDDSGNAVPEDYLDLQWSAANESVATVDQTGLVTGVANGTTEITVTDVTPGIDAQASAQSASPGAQSSRARAHQPDCGCTRTRRFRSTVAPEDIHNDSVTLPAGELRWTSSNAGIATVNQEGVVTVVGAGGVDA